MASSALRRGALVQHDKTRRNEDRDLQGNGLGSVVSPPEVVRYQRSRAERKLCTKNKSHFVQNSLGQLVLEH